MRICRSAAARACADHASRAYLLPAVPRRDVDVTDLCVFLSLSVALVLPAMWFGTTVALSHLIFEGTLDRFPGLRICAAHAGGYLASYSGRSDALCGRGAGADCKALKRKPSEYFRSQLYIDTMIFHEEGLRHLVAEVGTDHIFYGTDYPFDWPSGIDFVLDATVLGNGEKESILGGNSIKLLRITPSPW